MPSGTLTVRINVRDRMRIFGFDTSVVEATRTVWDIIAPEAEGVADAYW